MPSRASWCSPSSQPEGVGLVNLPLLLADAGTSEDSGKIRTELKTFPTPCGHNARRQETDDARAYEAKMQLAIFSK